MDLTFDPEIGLRLKIGFLNFEKNFLVLRYDEKVVLH